MHQSGNNGKSLGVWRSRPASIAKSRMSAAVRHEITNDSKLYSNDSNVPTKVHSPRAQIAESKSRSLLFPLALALTHALETDLDWFYFNYIFPPGGLFLMAWGNWL